MILKNVKNHLYCAIGIISLRVYMPSSRTMHMDYPWAWPSPGSYLSQGFSRGGVGTSRVRLLHVGTRNMALKLPFSSLYNCSEVLEPEASSPVPWPLIVPPPPRSFLPVGIGGWHHRCPHLATLKVVNSDSPPWSPPWWVPPYVLFSKAVRESVM